MKSAGIEFHCQRSLGQGGWPSVIVSTKSVLGQDRDGADVVDVMRLRIAVRVQTGGR